MTDTVDLLIRARFDAVANSRDDRDWNDVLARAHGWEIPAKRSMRRSGPRRVPARVALVAAVVALAAVVTAVAFGWPQRFVDFLSAPPASKPVQNWFSELSVDAPNGMDPHAIASQTRKIMTVRFPAETGAPVEHLISLTLYIAPKEGGGFCVFWTKIGGGCLPAKSIRTTPEARAHGPLDIVRYSSPAFPSLVFGTVWASATKTVEARLASGKTATIPVTQVSAPINAGFFIYELPQDEVVRGNDLKSVVALDSSGKVLGLVSVPSPYITPRDSGGTRRPPGGAALKKQKKLIARSTPVGLASIWGAPDRVSPAHCFWLRINRAVWSGSCVPNHTLRRGLSEVAAGVLPIKGRELPLLWGHAGANVARLSIIFQDGRRSNLSLQNGTFLYPVPRARWNKGHRPAFLAALNNHDQVVAKRLLREYTLDR